MKRQIVIAATLLGLLGLVNVSQAEQTPETVKCGTTIEKAGAQFSKKIVKGVEKCLAATRKCDGDTACIGKLLVLGKGKCAGGKLDEGTNFMGIGSAAQALQTSLSSIEKAYYKFVEKLNKKCFAGGVDFSTSPDGLGFDPVPNDKYELADALNAYDLFGTDESGIGCQAFITVHASNPDAIPLINTLLAQPTGPNLAWGVGVVLPNPFGDSCK